MGYPHSTVLNLVKLISEITLAFSEVMVWAMSQPVFSGNDVS
jgi:hypothetical protein